MGHVGMKYSLASREIIADSIECMVMALVLTHWYLSQTVTNCARNDNGGGKA